MPNQNKNGDVLHLTSVKELETRLEFWEQQLRNAETARDLASKVVDETRDELNYARLFLAGEVEIDPVEIDFFK